MKKIIIILSLIGVFGCIYSQNYNNSWGEISSSQVFIPKSPEVVAFDRYGEYPVNLCVGIPDITIPIYEIKSGSLELPITLSYHMGGIRVDDVATWVGLGWNLNAGGVISRTLKGGPDELINGFLTTSTRHIDLITRTGLTVSTPIPFSEEIYSNVDGNGGENNYNKLISYLSKFSTGKIDTQADIYNYNIHNISGSFTYNINRDLIQIPYTDNKINRENDGFKIISDNGTIYIFSKQNADIQRIVDNNASFGEYDSSWPISEIISADLNDTIKFKYTLAEVYTDVYTSTSITTGHTIVKDHSGIEVFKEITGTPTPSSYYSSSKEKKLEAIIFKNGSIEFNLSLEERMDKRRKKLDNIVIKNKAGEEIKKIVFGYDYFRSSDFKGRKEDYRLKLTSLKFELNELKYSFEYNETVQLPPYISMSLTPFYNSHYYAQDHWGFYNGVHNNTNLIGVLDPNIKDIQRYKSNREADERYMKACVLTRINYPTGGFTTFETEANKGYLGEDIGGLRIKKIKSVPGVDGQALITQYKYEDLEIISSMYTNKYSYNRYPIGIFLDGYNSHRFQTTHTESPVSGLEQYNGSPVLYRKVIQYKQESIFPSVEATIYTYMPVRKSSYISGSLTGSVINGTSFQDIPHKWTIGMLRKEETFKLGNSSYPVKKIEYEYDTYLDVPFTTGQIVVDAYLYPLGFKRGYNTYYSNAKGEYPSVWIKNRSGYSKLMKSTEITDSISIITEYKYGNKDTILSKRNFFITEKTTSLNKNQTKIIKYKYPQDYSSNPVYSNMILKNMLSYPIEEIYLQKKESRQQIEVMRKQQQYSIFNNSKTYLSSILTSASGETNLKTLVEYNNYDIFGNIIQYTSLEGIGTVLLWSYNGQYPIAEIKNSTYADVEKVVKTVFGVSDINALSKVDQPSEAKLKDGSLQKALPNALITTYTYQPLVGMTSMTDARGVTTTYEYDSFGRLKAAEDANGKVIQTYNYHYQNQ